MSELKKPGMKLWESENSADDIIESLNPVMSEAGSVLTLLSAPIIHSVGSVAPIPL